MTKPDPRITPYRDGLAAAHLKNRVKADNYIDAVRHQVMMPVVPLHKAPSSASMMDTQLILGASFDIYDIHNGWAWGQEVQGGGSKHSAGYVGYVPNMALARSARSPTHRIKTIRAPVFLKPDLKTAIRTSLPLNAKVFVDGTDGDYLHIPNMGYVHCNHIAPLEIATKANRRDFVKIAELHVGLPYIWGGISPDGIDCSGLVQTALRSVGEGVGKEAPRDTDMQEAALGTNLPKDATLKRGDLVFWQGHVGIMRDATELLHANAYHMLVASEPLKDAVTRIEKSAGPISSVKRL